MTITTTRPASFASTRAFEDLPHRHTCGARWSGSTTCHCGAVGCHITLSSVGAFTAHRKGGRCNPPAEVGLTLIPGRAYEVWGWPAEDAV
jgi:hypothetical protein